MLLFHPPQPGAGRGFAAALALVMASCLPVFGGEQVPSFSKAFSPVTIGPGSVSTLTFTLSNGAPVGIRGVRFTDHLPAGVTIASPANATINCDGDLSAPDGGTTISLTEGSVPGNGSCTITVDVTSAVIGTHTNVTEDLISDAGNSGSASADLTVAEELPGFSKSFSPATIGLLGRSTLTFTIDNSAHEGSRFRMSFADVLPAGMVVADPANVSSTCSGGTITANPGSSVISVQQDFTGGPSIGAFETCTVSVDVIGEGLGTLDNISGQLTSTSSIQDQDAVSSGKASASLRVNANDLILVKSFIDDPVVPGAPATMQFTIVNRNRDFPATDISFTDDLGATLPGVVAVGFPASDWCGAGSLLTGTSLVRLTGGRLGPGASCTFNVPLRVPATNPMGGSSAGTYPNTTSAITGVIDGNQVFGTPANDTLVVAALPILTKEFTDDPVSAGGTVTLRFTIQNTSQTSSATDIEFQDELPAELISAVQLPQDGFCGPGSTVSFTPSSQFDPARIIVSGASLDNGASCSFEVVFEVAPGASTGQVTNTTSPITATVDQVSVTGDPASDDLTIVSGPQLTKEFIGGPVLPGKEVVLRYTLFLGGEIPFNASDISFTDDLEAVLPGLVAIDLPKSDVCGAGSLLRGTSVIDFRGGQLRPGESCIFEVTLLVPARAPLGPVTNTTSAVTARVGGVTVMSAPANADLLVSSLSFRKEFIDDPVIPGGTVVLEFTITNDSNVPATGIQFTDDLDEALPGLAAIDLPISNVCGDGSSLTGAGVPRNSLLILQNGVLSAGESCAFRVRVSVPASTMDGEYVNTTSVLSAMIDGSEVTIPAATDALEVSQTRLQLTKTFTVDPATPGGATGLEFTLSNLDQSGTVSNIAFTDALPPGLLGAGGTMSNVCGAGSQVSGTTTLTFTGGRLGPGATCTFTVPIQVAPGAESGVLTNTTSEITGMIDGLTVIGTPASADLTIVPPADFFRLTKISFQPGGSVLVNWASNVGDRYCVQWSTDLESWVTVPGSVVAESEVGEWEDTGPPLTPSLPSTTSRRFYRVVKSNLPCVEGD